MSESKYFCLSVMSIYASLYCNSNYVGKVHSIFIRICFARVNVNVWYLAICLFVRVIVAARCCSGSSKISHWVDVPDSTP